MDGPGCSGTPFGEGRGRGRPKPDPLAEAWREAREQMVREQIQARGVRDPRVLAAMKAVPRHRFMDPSLGGEAYADWPLPIGCGQTISQPYMVAVMAEALELTGRERVLEVGSGSGYMAAVLSHLAAAVFGLDLEETLQRRATALLAELGLGNVQLACADGAKGWPEQAPFDAILLSCAAPGIPPALWEQLILGGRLLLPMGSSRGFQELVLARKLPEGSRITNLMPVSFVPLRSSR